MINMKEYREITLTLNLSNIISGLSQRDIQALNHNNTNCIFYNYKFDEINFDLLYL
jgi:hypothetical protein